MLTICQADDTENLKFRDVGCNRLSFEKYSICSEKAFQFNERLQSGSYYHSGMTGLFDGARNFRLKGVVTPE